MLTIGQMSKVCGVSVKTLHHYDKIGLLKPQKTDEANGYRYYEDSQIGTMLLIGRLKRYGFPLVDIQRLLTVKDSRELLRQMHQQKFRLERQMEHISITIREMGYHLEEFERTGDIMSYQNNYEIVVKEAGEQVLVTHRQKMSVEEFGTYYGKIYEKIAREHLGINGVVMAIYHDQEFDPAFSDIELGEVLRRGTRRTSSCRAISAPPPSTKARIPGFLTHTGLSWPGLTPVGIRWTECPMKSIGRPILTSFLRKSG